MTYKDQTFCNNWCNTTTCFRNYKHITDAQQPGGFLHENTWMPISFFIEPPLDCTSRTHKED